MKEAGRIMIFDPVVLLCDGGNRGFSGVVGGGDDGGGGVGDGACGVK